MVIFITCAGGADRCVALLRRFRDTYLAAGGAVHPSEVFRRFRGRDPTCDAFIQLHGLHRLGGQRG